MTIDVRWANDAQTIIEVVFQADWEPNEFYQLDPNTRAMLDTVSHPVVFVVDATEMRHIPRGLDYRLTSRVLATSHPNTRLIILVGLNRYVETMMNIILRIVPVTTNLKLMSTMEEAYRLAEDMHQENNSTDEAQ